MSWRVLVAGAGLLLLLAWHAAAVEVSIRSFAVESGPAYNWQLTSGLQSPQNITLYGNSTAAATFTVVSKRVAAGTGYIVSGKVVVSNTDSDGPISVETVRLLLGPGLPLLGPTSNTLGCRPRDLRPGATMACPFKLQLSNTFSRTVAASVLYGGRRSFTAEPVAIDYPEPTGTGSNCAVITDKIAANGAEKGITATGSTATVTALLGSGVQVCDDEASWTYTAELGPFGTSDVCGHYEFRNNPAVVVIGFGSSTVTSAAGNLFVSGCRQKDALGLVKPAVIVSKLLLGNLADSSWTVVTNSSSATPGVTLDSVPYNSTVMVKSAINISKTSSQSVDGLAGELTLVNNQVVPYVIAGVRVLVTPNATASRAADITPEADAASPAATAAPIQIILDANCPLSPQNNIIIPPQLLSAMPGVLRCTFTLPLNSSLTSGMVQAQLRTLFSATYEVDSGAPTPYAFAADATAVEDTSSCVEVWAQRITDASQVQAADMDSNPDLAAAMSSLNQPGVHLAPVPKRVVSGRVPPSRGGLLAIPLRVCGNKSIEWTELFGPFTSDSCGVILSVMEISLKPTKDKAATINTALTVPLSIKGCGLVPEASVEELLLTAKRVYTWNVETTQLTPSLSIPFDQKNLAQYNISYDRDYAVTGRKIQALVKVVNPLSQPVTVQKVTYTVSRPAGQAALSGMAICNESFSGAAQAAMDFMAATAFADITPGPSSEGLAVTSGPSTGVTSFSLPAAPAVINTPQPDDPPAIPAAGKAPPRLKFFNIDLSLKRGDKNKEEATASDDSQKDNLDMFYGSDPAAQSGPEPFYCSFVVNTPDEFDSEVSVTVVTDRMEEVEVVAPYKLDWSLATSYETGRCAMASTRFQQAQSASSLVPSTTLGSMPPDPDNAVRICEPTSFSFQAVYGPFSQDQCGNKQALVEAGVSVTGLQNLTKDISMTQITITGCPNSLPLVTLGHPTSTQVTAVYDWSVERTMRPLGASTAAPIVSVAASNARSAMTKALQLPGNVGGVTLFNQTITFRRSSPIPKTSATAQYQIKGSVSLLNPDSQAIQVREVQVNITTGSAKPVSVKAKCPNSFIKSATPPAKGTIISVPPSAGKASGQSVSCNYSAAVSGLSHVEVVAMVLMDDDQWTPASSPLSLDLKAAKPVALGGCVKISEAQVSTELDTKDTLGQQVAFVGNKVPTTAEELCHTKSFQAIGQVGPLQTATNGYGRAPYPADAGCGGVVYNSTVTAQPTSGPQGKLVSSGGIAVRIADCSAAKLQ